MLFMRSSPIILFLLFLVTFVFCTFPASRSLAAGNGSEQTAASDVNGQQINLQSEKYLKLFEELRNTHNFNQDDLGRIFSGLTLDKRVLSLMDQQAETTSFHAYLALLFTPAVVTAGKQKLALHQDLLDRIETELGVDREYIVAIWAIETRFGQKQGSFKVFQSLNTFFDAYPRRSLFFRKELIEFLLLCRENNMDPTTVMGSFAGAFGQTQFMPSSFREYAVSFDGDERRDVFESEPDILASIANYLRRHHWQLNGPVYADIGKKLNSESLINTYNEGNRGRASWLDIVKTQKVKIPEPPSGKALSIISFSRSPLLGGGERYIAGYPNFHAITAWNHSNKYAMAVCILAQALSK
jgi:membrane-bound lytic murein transglycosylase B